MVEPDRRGVVEERLRKRERALGWAVFAVVVLIALALAVLAVVALPLIVIAFPLTLAAILAVVLIGRVRSRRISGRRLR